MLAELDRLGTIAAVAKSLNLTPPGISMQLSGLERELGMQLTEKRGRRIVVTPAGHLLARHGSAIVDMLAIAEMEAAALRDGAVGTYRVAAFPTAARAILPAAWKTIADESQAGVHLRLFEMEPSVAMAALSAGDIELAVAHHYSNMPPLTGPGLTFTHVHDEVVRLAVNEQDWADSAGTVDLREFADHAWIVPNREWTCYDMVHRAADLAGFEPQTVAEATDFQVQLALVAAGVGVALVPELGAMDVPPGVRMLDLNVPIGRKILAVTRRGSSSDAGLRRVEAALVNAARRLLLPSIVPES